MIGHGVRTLGPAVILLATALHGAPISAQDPAEAWSRLNQTVLDAHSTGNLAEGVRHAEEAVELARTSFGTDDARTLTSIHNLAALYRDQGRYGEAEPLFQEVIARRRDTLGPNHPDTIRGLVDLADQYRAEGRNDEAAALLADLPVCSSAPD